MSSGGSGQVVRGWPFLVGRGYDSGFELIAAPPGSGKELLDTLQSSAIHRGGTLEQPGRAHVRADGKRWTILSFQARAQDLLGAASTTPLTDAHGRDLVVVGGLVIAGASEPSWEGALKDQIAAEIGAAYALFLAQPAGWVVAPSAAYDLGMQPATDDGPHTPKPQRLRGAALLIVALVGAAIGFVVSSALDDRASSAPCPGDQEVCLVVTDRGADDATWFDVLSFETFSGLDDCEEACLVEMVIAQGDR